MKTNIILIALFVAAFMFPSIGSVSNADALGNYGCGSPDKSTHVNCLRSLLSSTPFGLTVKQSRPSKDGLGNYGCGNSNKVAHTTCLRGILDQHGAHLQVGGQGYAPGTAPHLPLMDDPSASGSSYHLNQPVNQGGVKGVDPRLHPGMNASTTFDDVVSGATPADISHCANMTPTTRPACEAAAHGETPENHVPIDISHCANLEATAARPACEAAAHNVQP
jgi:hypothetical protein